VYAYVRTAWRKPVEDAKDLTQAFFAHILQKGYLTRLRPEGSFRGYIKRALKHFLIDCERADSVRRPPGHVMSVEMGGVELERLKSSGNDTSPDRCYDREWRRCLLLSAVGTLLQRLRADGKDLYAETFSIYCLDSPEAGETILDAGPGGPTYAGVAARLGLREHDVRNYLVICRGMLRQILRERVRDTVADESDVDGELAEILGS
jgi:hypothetical protein